MLRVDPWTLFVQFGARLRFATPSWVASLTPERMFDVLVASATDELTRSTIDRVGSSGQVEVIWRLYDRYHALRESGDPRYAKLAAIEMQFARVMLGMNAAESAYQALRNLMQSRAIEVLHEADAADLQKLYARACVRSGRRNEARGVLERLSARFPDDWTTYYALAQLTGDVESRLKYLSFAKQYAGDYAASIYVSLIQAHLHRKHYQEALEVCREGMEKNPTSTDLQLAMSNIAIARGDCSRWLELLTAYFDARKVPVKFVLDPESPMQSIFSGRAVAPPSTGDRTVTVIMTSYNSSRTIRCAIRSVLDQTYGNIRLVVVDDASTDGSLDIVREIAARDPRVSWLRNERNVGTYCSKNRALSEYRADYYAFHDSDDWMHPERIQRHIAFMESNPDAACSTSLWYRMNEDGLALSRSNGFLHNNPASMFLRRNVLDAVGYFDSVRAGADTEFVNRLRRRLGSRSVSRLALPLAIGMHRDNSLTTGGMTAFDGNRFSAVRLKYWEAWAEWHRQSARQSKPDLFISFPLERRPFEAPGELLPGR